MKKTYAVFGLGRYGIAVARELVHNGVEVIAVDTDERIVNAAADAPLGDTEAAGAVALRIQIDEQYLASQRCHAGGQIDSGGGFTHAALLVGDGDDFSHSGTLLRNFWCKNGT